MYMYTSSLFIKYETRQYILRKDESHFAMPLIVWYFSLRFDLSSFCLLFVVINISLFLFISIWFFYSYMFYLPPLNGCRYGEKPQSMCYLYIKFQTLDNKLRKLKYLVIRSSYMSILLNVLVLNVNRCITYVDFV